jgi:hypothetical protein
MMKENGSLYFNMILGTIGMVLIGLGFIQLFQLGLQMDHQGIPFSIIGYSFTNGYIFYLERKAGISNKLVWTQSIIGVSMLAILSYWLFL